MPAETGEIIQELRFLVIRVERHTLFRLQSHGDLPRSFEELLKDPHASPLRHRMEGRDGTLGHRSFHLGLPMVPSREYFDAMRHLSKHSIDGSQRLHSLFTKIGYEATNEDTNYTFSRGSWGIVFLL